MGVEHSGQLIWGLPWNELVDESGTHIDERIAPANSTYRKSAIQHSIEALANLRVDGHLFSQRWSLGVFETSDYHDLDPKHRALGIEAASWYAKGEGSSDGVEMGELEARRRCAQQELQKLGIHAAPRLLLLTGSC